MPGRVIPLVSGQYYHIYNRGVNKQPVFSGVKTYKRALDLLRYYRYSDVPIRFSKFLTLSKEVQSQIWDSLELKDQKLVEIICFCLMPNHFHLLVKQNKEGGISKFLGDFQNGYTRYFNLKDDRSGPMWQGRFKAVRIGDDEQLLHVNRYIHLNPATAYVVNEFDDLLKYAWSSLGEYLGKDRIKISNPEIILSNFASIDKYIQFLADQVGYQRELDQIKHLVLE